MTALLTKDNLPVLYLGLATLDLFVIVAMLATLAGERDPYFAAVLPLLWVHLLFCALRFSFLMEEI